MPCQTNCRPDPGAVSQRENRLPNVPSSSLGYMVNDCHIVTWFICTGCPTLWYEQQDREQDLKWYICEVTLPDSCSPSEEAIVVPSSIFCKSFEMPSMTEKDSDRWHTLLFDYIGSDTSTSKMLTVRGREDENKRWCVEQNHEILNYLEQYKKIAKAVTKSYYHAYWYTKVKNIPEEILIHPQISYGLLLLKCTKWNINERVRGIYLPAAALAAFCSAW